MGLVGSIYLMPDQTAPQSCEITFTCLYDAFATVLSGEDRV